MITNVMEISDIFLYSYPFNQGNRNEATKGACFGYKKQI